MFSPLFLPLLLGPYDLTTRFPNFVLRFRPKSVFPFSVFGAKHDIYLWIQIIVDANPKFEGKTLLARLLAHGIPCTYVLLTAISYVIRKPTKCLLGAHGLLSNGSVVGRTGTLPLHPCHRSSVSGFLPPLDSKILNFACFHFLRIVLRGC